MYVMKSLPRTTDDFAEWVRPHLPAMSRLAARLAPGCDRDDIVQEALVRAWRKRRLFDPDRGTASAWLLALTADRARRARTRQPVVLELTDVAGAPARDDAVLDLGRALDRLSPRQRLAVDCVYFAGLSVAETAAVMKCADGTVKSTLSDARARLRTALEVSG
jgi:RNA polymerase sigma-70 factor (ECF subfamily)